MTIPAARLARRQAARIALCLGLVLFMGARAAARDGYRIPNGDLTEWKDGKPVGWEVSIGARSGTGPVSTLRALDGGGLALSGDESTGTWRYLSQRTPISRGDYVRLDFEAGVRNRRLDRGQYESCYVGFVYRDAAGQRVGMHIHDVHGGVEPATIFARVPKAAKGVEVAIFLSMTGVLEVRSVSLAWLDPVHSYDALVADMDRHYSFFAAHGIDWKRLGDAHRFAALEAPAPADAAAFARAIQPLLASLEDPHVSIEMPDGRRIPTVTKDVTPNVDYSVTARGLTDIGQIGRTAFVGRTKRGGFGFLAVASLQQPEVEFRQVDAALRSLLDTPALILDLRANIGGAEVRAQKLASYLAKERTLYARSRVRSGTAHDALVDGGARHVVPHASIRYEKPVACLIGPVCMSSGEGFAMMMKALPNVVLLGQPTRGASGNPQPVYLPNGVTVHYSRWISLLPDGTPIERRGVPPDIVVKHEGAGDPTLDAAIAELERRLKTR